MLLITGLTFKKNNNLDKKKRMQTWVKIKANRKMLSHIFYRKITFLVLGSDVTIATAAVEMCVQTQSSCYLTTARYAHLTHPGRNPQFKFTLTIQQKYRSVKSPTVSEEQKSERN